ncbi:hypothetical protein K435DRAFT_403355 [Dendrothele bispora CBS 962.96]|uniref:Fork-head domain-containing protein n=1 Tax=Dendrothele bispora (strain CBS 962.96) TaxID=1314807 RepID=A0A4S8L8I4_DENBC|nr:hypothetical protein K435DRAFT_403355 [Dendrothele bispora CBS 962.96]
MLTNMQASESPQNNDTHVPSQLNDTVSHFKGSPSMLEPKFCTEDIVNMSNYDTMVPCGYLFGRQTLCSPSQLNDATNSNGLGPVLPAESTFIDVPSNIPFSSDSLHSNVEGFYEQMVYPLAEVEGQIQYYPAVAEFVPCGCPSCVGQNAYTCNTVDSYNPSIPTQKPTWDVPPSFVSPSLSTSSVSSPESSSLGTPELPDCYPIQSQGAILSQTYPKAADHERFEYNPLDPDNDAAWDLCPGTGERLRNLFNLPSGPLSLNILPDCDDPTTKPPVRYGLLVALAIYGSKNRRLNLQGIYSAISQRYPFFRNTKERSWKSVRNVCRQTKSGRR